MAGQIARNLRLLTGNLNFWIAVVAGAVYSSWPLGFMLNPLVARTQFASGLEASHQPYAWVFVGLDIACGVLMTIVGIRQWRQARHALSLRLSIIAYVLFGILVIAAAVAPYNCQSGTAGCQMLLHSPAFIIHGFSSIVSVIFLLMSLVLPAKLLIERKMYRWLVLLAVFILAGWGFTGIGTLIVMAHGMRSVWLQYDFITICSVTVIGALALIEYLSLYHLKPVVLEKSPSLAVPRAKSLTDA